MEMEYVNQQGREADGAASSSRSSSRRNVGQGERVASLVGGGLLTLWGLRRFSAGGLLTAAAGGALLYRGATGHCSVYEQAGIDTARGPKGHAGGGPVEVQEVLTVYKPRHEVYGFWRDVTNFPRFMRHLQAVEDVGEGRSRWTARAPKGLTTITWTARLTEDEENEKVAWRSEPGADVENAGAVRFKDAPEGRDGTEVHVEISYRPPAGAAGELGAQLLNPAFEQLIKEDVRRFKRLMETGEVPQIEGQPTGKGRT